MTKKELALETVARLKKEYPDAGCTLEYEDAWKLLISVRLAAQCTYARVNQVVPGLYENFQQSVLWQTQMNQILKRLCVHVDLEKVRQET